VLEDDGTDDDDDDVDLEVVVVVEVEEPAPKPRGVRTSSRPPTRQEQRDNALRLRSGRPLIPEGSDGPPVREQRTKVPINKTEHRW